MNHVGRHTIVCMLLIAANRLARKSGLCLPHDQQVMYDVCEPTPERAEVLEIIDGQSVYGGRSKLSIFSLSTVRSDQLGAETSDC